MSEEIEVNTQENEVLTAESPVNTETKEVTWKDSVSEDYKDLVKDYNTVDDLAKTLKSSQEMIGRSIRIPTEDASEEAKQEFYNKLKEVPGITRLPDPNDTEALNSFYNSLGRPESPDNYKIDVEEGVDPNTLNQFTELAHSIGLTNEQAAKLAQFESARYKDYEESIVEGRNKAEEALKAEWGQDYDNRLLGAKEVLNVYKDKYPEAINELVQGPAGNNPAFLSMLSELYGSLKESGTLQVSQRVNYGMSTTEAKEQINDIMDNSSHAYFNENDPGHREAVNKMSKLFETAYPDG